MDASRKPKSIRLPGYDYSRAGAYFVSICTKDRKCLFGEIVNQEMVLNDAGRMVEKWYAELLRTHHSQRERIDPNPGIHQEQHRSMGYR